MPSDDLILSVRQITQYPVKTAVTPSDAVLLQTGGIGGPYAYAAVSDLVATALMTGGSQRTMIVGSIQAGEIDVQNINARGITAATGVISSLSGLAADFTTLTTGSLPVATQSYVNSSIGTVTARRVTTFDGRTGDIILNLSDVTAAGAAPINSPIFGGNPLANTPQTNDNSNRLATTEFVWDAVDCAIDAVLQTNLVTTWNGRGGDVLMTIDDITNAGGAPRDTPVFIGNPTAPTPAAADNSQSIATTAFVQAAITAAGGTIYAPLNSPVFTGVPTAPTAAPGSSTGQLATTAFVHNAITAATTGVSSFNTRTGAVVLISADITSAGGALLASPIFTGTPASTTPAPGDNSTKIATTAFVDTALANATIGVMTFNGRSGVVTLTSADITGAGGALLASPALSGTPTAPTALAGTNTTQIATTAFVMGQLAAGAVSSWNGRTGAVTMNVNDISAAGGAVLASPAFTGIPTAPTAAPSDSSATLATTAFVQAAITASGHVTSFNGRNGAVVLTLADITGAGGAPVASPGLSGIPTAPTATAGTSNTQIATTAFVTAGFAPISSPTFLGTVTIPAGASIAGYAPIASPVLTGVPAAPTATAGTNTTQIATTQFVTSALATGAVQSFNARTGAVVLNVNDITAAGGAPVASPGLTGVPTAPTPLAGDNSTAIATTAFVDAALASAVAGVSSWNTRTGAVVMNITDITNAGGAPLSSPVFVGTPQSVTTPIADNSTAIATTAYVKGQGYAPINSPVFTGTVTIPAGASIAGYATTAAVASTTISTVKHQIFSASGTYTPTAGMKFCIVELVGGGGGGGGSPYPSTANLATCGGGGGSGGYVRSLFTAAQIGASQPVTIGNGGAQGAGPQTGSAGTASTFGGSLVVANGGAGGTSMGGNGANYYMVAGGGGGSGSGDYALRGNCGGYGSCGYGSVGAVAIGGQGGPSFLGGGSTGVLAAGTAQNGSSGPANSGAGGVGAASALSGTAAQGGPGGSGVAIITEFI